MIKVTTKRQNVGMCFINFGNDVRNWAYIRLGIKIKYNRYKVCLINPWQIYFAGSNRLVATYLSGKICPLTPSQQPTNVQHLVVNHAPMASNLSLKGQNCSNQQNLDIEMKTLQSRVIPLRDPVSDNSSFVGGMEAGTMSNQINENDAESNGYCKIM